GLAVAAAAAAADALRATNCPLDVGKRMQAHGLKGDQATGGTMPESRRRNCGWLRGTSKVAVATCRGRRVRPSGRTVGRFGGRRVRVQPGEVLREAQPEQAV